MATLVSLSKIYNHNVIRLPEHISSCKSSSIRHTQSHRQAMLQLHLSDQQVYSLLGCDLYSMFHYTSGPHRVSNTTGCMLPARKNGPFMRDITVTLHERHGVWNHWQLDWFYSRTFSKLHITGQPMVGGFPSQRVSNAERVPMSRYTRVPNRYANTWQIKF